MYKASQGVPDYPNSSNEFLERVWHEMFKLVLNISVILKQSTDNMINPIILLRNSISLACMILE